jgi:23S rRNA-/tRNA-specific pseudouridylate synthase
MHCGVLFIWKCLSLSWLHATGSGKVILPVFQRGTISLSSVDLSISRHIAPSGRASKLIHVAYASRSGDSFSFNRLGLNSRLSGSRTLAIACDRASAVTSSTSSLSRIGIAVLYEDDHILVANKAAGILVYGKNSMNSTSFVEAFLDHIGENATKALQSYAVGNNGTSEVERLGIVHRLDRDTTGVLIAAKTVDAMIHMKEMFALRRIEKWYLAVCHGYPGNITIDAPIRRCIFDRTRMEVVSSDCLSGKSAVSHVYTLAFNGKESVVLVNIETGRCLPER